MTAWVALLFFGGIALIIAEFLLPGGVLGTVGGLMVLASMGLAIYHLPDYAMVIILLEFLGTVLAVFTGLLMFPKTRTGKRMTLAQGLDLASGFVSDVTDDSLIGQEGEVHTQLRPAGVVLLNGRRLDAVSNGTFIPKGTLVRVVEVHGNRIVVEPAEEEQ